MPRRPRSNDLQITLKRLIRRDPRWLIALLLIGAVTLLFDRCASDPTPGLAPPSPAEGYLFCSWNVENLFDDSDDPKNNDPLDEWFATDRAALRRKLELIVEALLRLNNGRGPDALALIEVENRRAVELLQQALNARLSTEWHYNTIVHVDNRSGRRIEPALLTRLPIDPTEAQEFDENRLLRASIIVEGRPLDVIIGHWTSRVTDRDGSRRLSYAREMYERYLEIERRTPNRADVLLCGDFNDEPDDESVRLGLRATGDRSAVIDSADSPRPLMLNLMAGRNSEQFGSYRYRGRWQMLDQIVASPGLLDDDGWQLVPDSLQTIRPPGQGGSATGPLRFGDRDNQNPRGPSDHFPVSVRLRPPSAKTIEKVASGAGALGE